MTYGAAATQLSIAKSHPNRPGGGVEREVRGVPKGVDAHAFDRGDPVETLCGLDMALLHVLDPDFESLGPARRCPACSAAAGT